MIVLAFLLMRGGDAFLLWYCFLPTTAAPFLRGLAIGSVLWTSVLTFMVWRRQRWSRYVLTGMNWGYVAILSYPVLQGMNEPWVGAGRNLILVLLGIVFYSVGNSILIRSRRVRHFANQ